MRHPRTGDRVSLAGFPDDEYRIYACYGTQCGITSDGWPRGGTSQISLHELATVNGQPVKFPEPVEENPRRTRNRR